MQHKLLVSATKKAHTECKLLKDQDISTLHELNFYYKF